MNTSQPTFPDLLVILLCRRSNCYVDLFSLAQIWRDIYLLSCCVLFCVVLFFQMSPRFLSWRWYRRVGFYCAVCGYGIIPAVHWVHLSGGLSADIVQVLFIFICLGALKCIPRGKACRCRVTIIDIFRHSIGRKQKKQLRITLFTRQVFFPKVLVMYFIGGLAFFFYLSKFPEKFFPGEQSKIVSS